MTLASSILTGNTPAQATVALRNDIALVPSLKSRVREPDSKTKRVSEGSGGW